jgi:heat shock protein HtpX
LKETVARICVLLVGSAVLAVPAAESRPGLFGCKQGRSYAGIEDVSGGRFAGVRAVARANGTFSGLDRKSDWMAGWIALGYRPRGDVELALRSTGLPRRVAVSTHWQGRRTHDEPLRVFSYVPWTVDQPHSLLIERIGSSSNWRLEVDGGTTRVVSIPGSAKGLSSPRVYLTAMNAERPCDNRGKFLFTEIYVKSTRGGNWMPFSRSARAGFTTTTYPVRRLSRTSFLAGSGVTEGISWLRIYGAGLVVALLSAMGLVVTWSRRSFAMDRSLFLRMLAVSSLLVAAYLPFLALGVVWVYGRTSSLQDAIFAAVVELGCLASMPLLANRAVLKAARACIVGRDQSPELHDALERLCALTNLPKPRLAIIPSNAPNAFAAGTGTRATIAVSEGLLTVLAPQELEAVLAHELAHIANGDAYAMTILNAPGALIARIIEPFIVAPTGLKTTRGRVFGYLAVFLFPLVLIAWLTWSLGALLVAWLSRYREFIADRGAAHLTGAPEQLMSALVRIAAELERIPDRDLRGLASTNAFLIVPVPTESQGLTLHPAQMFPSHPNLGQRLDRLAAAVRKTGRSVAPPQEQSPSSRGRRPTNRAAWIALAFGLVSASLSVPGIIPASRTITSAIAIFVFFVGSPLAFHALAKAQRGAAALPCAAVALALCLMPWLVYALGAFSYVIASSLHWVHIIQRG